MIIGVDLDGVCCDFCGGFSSYLNDKYNLNITEDKITSWHWWEIEEFNLTKEMWLESFSEFTNFKMWQDLEIFPHVKNVLCALSKKHEIYYLTDRPNESRRSTLKFILKNGLPVDSIFFCDSSKKSLIAKTLSIDVTIDDKPSTIIDYKKNNIKTIIKHMPCNANLQFEDIPRVKDMREFHQEVLKLEKEMF